MKMVKYSEAPKDIELALAESERVVDFLPPPEDLQKKMENYTEKAGA